MLQDKVNLKYSVPVALSCVLGPDKCSECHTLVEVAVELGARYPLHVWV